MLTKYQRAEKIEVPSKEDQEKLNSMEKTARTLENLDKK